MTNADTIRKHSEPRPVRQIGGGAPPLAVLLIGLGGSGKSTVARLLASALRSRSRRFHVIQFDRLRTRLAPPGADPFSADPRIRGAIYEAGIDHFKRCLGAGTPLIIDAGLSVESIRERLRRAIPGLKIVHLDCPLPIAIYRDIVRSLGRRRHPRGSFLYLRALMSLVNPRGASRFPQPGITCPFEYPRSADLHVRAFRASPKQIAAQIVTKLRLA